MAKRWKPQEITYLKRYAKVRLLKELAERFKTTPEEVLKQLKIQQLGTKDGHGYIERPPDPMVAVYERGMKGLHRGNWKSAARDFQRVLDESSEPDLVGQARRYLRTCKERLGEGADTGEDDPFLTAVYERNRGNLDEALSICSRGGRQSKDERFAYLAASIYALMDEREKAGSFLSLAIELNPKNRIHAFHDADFETLRADPEYSQLFF
jgi:tetratricopeptide (TPR) repeat protein